MLDGINVGYKALNWDTGNKATKNGLSGGMMDKAGQSQAKAKELYNKSIEQLASGLQLNRAADNAAGLTITEKFKSMIKGSSTAMKAIGDGMSALGTASAGVNASTENLQRMRELAVQASTETLSDADRANLNDEFVALKDSLDKNAQVSFNGKKLLDGSAGTMSIVTSADGGSADLNFSRDLSSGGLNLTPSVINTKSGAEAAIDEIDTALDTLSTAASEFGASENALAGHSERLNVSIQEMEAARAKIADTDYSKTSSMAVQGYVQQMLTAGVANTAKNLAGSNVVGLLPASKARLA